MTQLLAHSSFDHSTGAQQQGLRDLETKCSGRLEVDQQFVLFRAIDRQVRRARAAKDSIDVVRATRDGLRKCARRAEGKQAARLDD